MGRELRRVIPNWEHPKEERYNYREQENEEVYSVLLDSAFEPVMDDWVDEYQSWKNGKGEYALEKKTLDEFLDWIGTPPDPKYYRPNWDEADMTWYQVYETVSEGTPITPPFETKDELIDWMSNNLDFWDKKWTRKQAEYFVNGSGFAVSGILINGEVKMGYEVTN